MYRHALPPGFVLKSEKKAAEEAAKKEQISLEEFLEVEASSLSQSMNRADLSSGTSSSLLLRL